MIDTLKKTLLAGVGAAVVTKEKAEAALADFVAQGKVSAADARKMAAKIAADGKVEFEQASKDLGRRIKDVMARSDAKTQERLAALEARIKALEGKAVRSTRPRKS
ncbi:MAG: phasin family protein [Cephaloticoccus sp.]